MPQAIDECWKALALTPAHPEAHGNLAPALANGDVEAALRHCNEAVRLQPENLELRLAYGQLMRRGKDRGGYRAVRIFPCCRSRGRTIGCDGRNQRCNGAGERSTALVENNPAHSFRSATIG